MIISKIIMHAVKYCHVKTDSTEDFHDSFYNNVIFKTSDINIMKSAFKVIYEKDILTMRTVLIRVTIAVKIVIIFLNHDDLC